MPPWSATVTTAPALSSSSVATCWFISLSSTSRTRMPRALYSADAALRWRYAPALSSRDAEQIHQRVIEHRRIDRFQSGSRRCRSARPATRTSSRPNAVTMTMRGMFFRRPSRLMMALACKPSIPGMCQSISTS